MWDCETDDDGDGDCDDDDEDDEDDDDDGGGGGGRGDDDVDAVTSHRVQRVPDATWCHPRKHEQSQAGWYSMFL